MRAFGVSISNKFTNWVSYIITILHLKRQIGSVPCTCKTHLEKSNRWRKDRDFIIPPRNLLQKWKIQQAVSHPLPLHLPCSAIQWSEIVAAPRASPPTLPTRTRRLASRAPCQMILMFWPPDGKRKYVE